MTSDEEQGVEQSQRGEVGSTATACVDAIRLEEVDIDDSPVKNESADQKRESKAFTERLLAFYRQYDFLILLIVAVLLAKAYPPLGAVYVAPQITATWIAVMYIFFISGLCLRTDEFHDAIKQIKFHAFVQTYNFLFISSMVFGITRLLISTGLLFQSLGDGMLICSCLPMAINMVIVLSKTADGDDGAAVFNSAFGNLLGVFLSPLLILGYLGVSGDVNLGEIFYKLVIRVVVPIAIGQLLQKLSKTVSDFVKKYKALLSKSQMYALIFIVYTVFCQTFTTGIAVSAAEFVLVLVLQVSLLISFMIVAWYGLKLVFPKEPRLRVTGVYGCTFKTVSLGVPLINAMYEGSPNLAMYILPLLMWYPTQLAVGSILAPRFYKFVQQQVEELSGAGVDVDDGDAPTDDGGGDSVSVASKDFVNNNQLRTGKDSPICVSDVESPPVGVDSHQDN